MYHLSAACDKRGEHAALARIGNGANDCTTSRWLETSAFVLRAFDAIQVTGKRRCGKPAGGGNLPNAWSSFENAAVAGHWPST